MTVLRASNPSFLIVFLTTLILCVNSAPVEYQMIDFGARPDDWRRTKEAQNDAYLFIAKTSHVLNKHPDHPQIKDALVKSFGKKYNLKEITNNFNILETSTDPVKVTYANYFSEHSYDTSTVITPKPGQPPSKAQVALHNHFHYLSEDERGAEMVKVASQVVCSTTDHFKVEGSGQSCKIIPIDFRERRDRVQKLKLPTLSGKHGSKDLAQLKQSDQMHMNADSYGKLAHAVHDIIPGSRPGSPDYSASNMPSPARQRSHSPSLLYSTNNVPPGSPHGSTGGRRLGSPGPSRLNGNTKNSLSPGRQRSQSPSLSHSTNSPGSPAGTGGRRLRSSSRLRNENTRTSHIPATQRSQSPKLSHSKNNSPPGSRPGSPGFPQHRPESPGFPQLIYMQNVHNDSPTLSHPNTNIPHPHILLAPKITVEVKKETTEFLHFDPHGKEMDASGFTGTYLTEHELVGKGSGHQQWQSPNLQKGVKLAVVQHPRIPLTFSVSSKGGGSSLSGSSSRKEKPSKRAPVRTPSQPATVSVPQPPPPPHNYGSMVAPHMGSSPSKSYSRQLTIAAPPHQSSSRSKSPGGSLSRPKSPGPLPMRMPSPPRLGHPNVQHLPAFHAAEAFVPQHLPPAQHHGFTTPVQIHMHPAHPHGSGSGSNHPHQSAPSHSRPISIRPNSPSKSMHQSGKGKGVKRPGPGSPSSRGPPSKKTRH